MGIRENAARGWDFVAPASSTAIAQAQTPHRQRLRSLNGKLGLATQMRRRLLMMLRLSLVVLMAPVLLKTISRTMPVIRKRRKIKRIQPFLVSILMAGPWRTGKAERTSNRMPKKREI